MLESYFDDYGYANYARAYSRGLRGEVAMLLVEHDMTAVFALADRISVLVYGAIIASGDGATIQSDPLVREAYLGVGDA